MAPEALLPPEGRDCYHHARRDHIKFLKLSSMCSEMGVLFLCSCQIRHYLLAEVGPLQNEQQIPCLPLPSYLQLLPLPVIELPPFPFISSALAALHLFPISVFSGRCLSCKQQTPLLDNLSRNRMQ